MSIAPLIEKLKDRNEADAFVYSDQLAGIGSPEVIDEMIKLLYDDDVEAQHLAARTLGKIEENQSALEPLIEALNDPATKAAHGSFMEAMLEFDISSKFVEVLKLYLNGSFKVSGMAKWALDFKEFDITPRVLKKARKHWDHYTHNTKHDEEFEMKKQEVETIFSDLEDLLEN
ncbi:MAG: HEAT repeat domain-containing protein [Cyclobacteriaceae bacterium]